MHDRPVNVVGGGAPFSTQSMRPAELLVARKTAARSWLAYHRSKRRAVRRAADRRTAGGKVVVHGARLLDETRRVVLEGAVSVPLEGGEQRPVSLTLAVADGVCPALKDLLSPVLGEAHPP